MSATLTFADRITNLLMAAGYTGATRFTPKGRPAFTVTEGVGATVGLSLEADDGERSRWLARYEACLGAAGLTVENRGNCLYVHDPDREERDPVSTEAFRVSADIIDGNGRRARASFIVRSGAGWKWAVEQAHMHLEGMVVTGDVAVDQVWPDGDGER
jgi:hypothetical protein